MRSGRFLPGVWLLLTGLFALAPADGGAQSDVLTVVELNVENLFDTRHDSLKDDREWLPKGSRHWSRRKYWDKLNRLGQTILACGEDSDGWGLPDLVGLCEVENDSCLYDLTRRSLLRRAEYEYVMTQSPDRRGIDVALLYSPYTFRLLNSHSLRVKPTADMHPTRDILYASGRLTTGDTLHIFVLHAPSRLGGGRQTQPHRRRVMDCICSAIDSVRTVSPKALLLVMGDFNEYADGESLQQLASRNVDDVSAQAQGSHGARGTYKYKGRWGSLDHIAVSSEWQGMVVGCKIYDAEFLLEDDKKYGGVQPRRTYIGYRYHNGFSDHLPLVMRMRLTP